MSDDERRIDVRFVARSILVPLLALYVAVVAVGMLITDHFAHAWPFTAEDNVNRWLASHRTPALDTVTGVFSVLADTACTIGLTAAVVAWTAWHYRRWREPVFLASAVAAQAAVFLLTTLVIDRPRPAVAHLDAAPPTSSFPSGHSGAALALFGGIACVLVRHVRRRWAAVPIWALALLVPACVAFSRLYRGMHHPTDVATGLLNGACCLAILAHGLLLPRHTAATVDTADDTGSAHPRSARKRGAVSA